MIAADEVLFPEVHASLLQLSCTSAALTDAPGQSCCFDLL
jgi:hypothetical protein